MQQLLWRKGEDGLTEGMVRCRDQSTLGWIGAWRGVSWDFMGEDMRRCVEATHYVFGLVQDMGSEDICGAVSFIGFGYGEPLLYIRWRTWCPGLFGPWRSRQKDLAI